MTSILKRVAIAGGLLLGAGGALAADLPPHAYPVEPVAPVQVAIGSGWYLRGDVGVGIYDNYEPQVILPQGTSVDKSFKFVGKEIEDTVFIGGGVGYQFNSFLRFDGTLEYRTATKFENIDKSKYGNTFVYQDGTVGNETIFQSNKTVGSLSSIVALANVYFDLGTWHGLSPFVGAGVGFAHNRVGKLNDFGSVEIQSDVEQTKFFSPMAYSNAREKTDLAWAVHAGLGYEITQNLKLELAYRYLNMGDAHSGGLITLPKHEIDGRGVKLKEIESHDIKLGMRWTFADYGYHAPVVHAAAPIRKY